MEAINRFSLMDFLAYFFPGVVGVLGFYLLLLLIPLRDFFALLTMDITLAVLLLTLSYIVGVILSGFSITIEKLFKKVLRQENSHRGLMPIPEFKEEIISAFKDIFSVEKEAELQWSAICFYLCRSLVLECMPNSAQIARRQNSLRQLRTNLITPVFIWFFVGISWGVWSILNNLVIWGVFSSLQQSFYHFQQ